MNPSRSAALDAAVFITPSIDDPDLSHARQETWQLSAQDKKTMAIKEPSSGELDCPDPYQCIGTLGKPVVDNNANPKLEKLAPKELKSLEKLGKAEFYNPKLEKVSPAFMIGKLAVDYADKQFGPVKHTKELPKKFIDKSMVDKKIVDKKLTDEDLIILKKKLAALAEEKHPQSTKPVDAPPVKKLPFSFDHGKNEPKKPDGDNSAPQKIYPGGSIGKILKEHPTKVEKYDFDSKPYVYESSDFENKLTPAQIKKLEEMKHQK